MKILQKESQRFGQMRAAMMLLTDMQEHEYLAQVLASGIEWLRANVNDAFYFKVLLFSNAYWAWYANQFLIIDQAIIENAANPDPLDYVLITVDGPVRINKMQHWLEQHKPEKYTFYPSQAIYDMANEEYIKSKVHDVVGADTNHGQKMIKEVKE
jgi:hypothetical protein